MRNSQYTEKSAGEDPHFCPINAVLNLMSSRWTLHIVRALLEGRTRFNDLARAQHINPRTLRERLRDLEDEQIITRTVISALPPHVEYELTEKGRALNGVMEQLHNWGVAWMKPRNVKECVPEMAVASEE